MKGKNALCADREWIETHLNSSDNQSPPVIYLGPARIGLPGISKLGESDSYGSTVGEVLSGPFSGGRLNAAIDFLYAKARKMLEQEKAQDTPTDDRKAWNFWSIEKLTHSCAKAICEEVLDSDRALNYPTGLDVGFIGDEPMADLDSVNINRLLGVDTTDTPTFDHIRPEDRPIGWDGPDSGRRVSLAGSLVQLTDTEYRMPLELSANAGRVLLREELLQRAGGISWTRRLRLLRGRSPR